MAFLIFKNLKKIPVFSDLYASFDEDTNHSFMFFVNIEEILKTKTKYGRFLHNISDSVIKNIVNYDS